MAGAVSLQPPRTAGILAIGLSASFSVSFAAGGVAEALFGIPDDIADQGWARLPHDMREVLTHLYQEAGMLV